MCWFALYHSSDHQRSGILLHAAGIGRVVCEFHAEAQVTALRQQQPAVQDSRQQAGIAAASQVTLQSPEDEDEEHMLDIREPYDEHFHGDLQLQTSIPSKHMQPQVPQAVLVTGDTTAPPISGALREKSTSLIHQPVVENSAHPDYNPGIWF